MADPKNQFSEKKDEKLHFRSEADKNPSNPAGIQTDSGRSQNKSQANAGNIQAGSRERQAHNKAGDKNTGHSQTTVIKGENPGQSHSPVAGKEQEAEEPGLDATFGKSGGNLGTKTPSGDLRGPKGIINQSSGKRGKK